MIKLNSDQEKTPLAQSEDLGNSLHNVQKLLKRNEVRILHFFYVSKKINFSKFRAQGLNFGLPKIAHFQKYNFEIGLEAQNREHFLV